MRRLPSFERTRMARRWAPSPTVALSQYTEKPTFGWLGSLEPGKWADLVVLNRDYLTVPVDEIPKLRVLMTMVGGKLVHLVPSLAREWSMEPTGAQVELGGAAARW